MSCRGHGPGREDENCVCGVLRAIVDAQDQVSPVDDDNCDVSCQRSINILLGDVVAPTNGPNTIPVILYCGCEPFLGTGVRVETVGQNQRFECVQSFVFRVNSVDDNCCATLELLDTGDNVNPNGGVCSQFQGNAGPGSVEGTGICITVDLNCFCAVTCLDPVRVD